MPNLVKALTWPLIFVLLVYLIYTNGGLIGVTNLIVYGKDYGVAP